MVKFGVNNCNKGTENCFHNLEVIHEDATATLSMVENEFGERSTVFRGDYNSAKIYMR